MRLKQCIFALVAMLLCAFSANAQGSGVAKIGSTTYDTFTEALTAANEMSGDVTIEVYDKVTLNTAFSGSYSSINFVGKDTDAEIYLDVQGYITATGKKVSFTDLTLSKSEGDYLTNAGFMNVAFGIYDVVEVTYTNCVFANGAYASSGNVTFTGCTFKKSWEKYGLWAYGNVNVAVEGCKFDNDRGIKMYAEDKAKTTDLTVKSCDFSALTGKPAIVLTYGESVVLEGNTYSSTGTFELDKDGDPNGTAVTSDVAPTCMNDDYPACGVLVDGKIYTTAAQAAEVAAEGSNVTLLYSTTDAVEFAEGVNLTLADGVTAENVTVPASGVAKIGETSYATLAEAVAAAESGATITLMNGEHELPAFSNKELTFVGESKDGVIVNDAPNANVQGWVGSTIHFENLTAKGINANYYGLANGVVAVTYKDCILNNQRFLYAETVTFEDCVFNQTSSDWYNVWTYSAENVTFTRCTFNCAGKSVLVYHDTPPAGTDGISTNLTVTECAFVATSTIAGKAAIEIDTSTMAGATITVDGATTVNDTFGSGNVSGNTLWNNKKGSEGVNNDITVVVDNVTVLKPVTAVAKIGDVEYETLAEAIAAVGAGDVVIELLDDVTLDYGAREAYGTAETTSVTINGNGKTLTLNQTNSDWSSFGLAAGKVAFNNVTIEKTGYGDTSGAWNTHAIIFSSPVEMTNVIVNNSMAVQAGATLNNVTINEANGYYGLWVNGNGQTVTMNGGAINATNGGRGIKVADQYIDAPAQVTLNVTGTAFNTAKKAAVLVSSTAGAKIAASNVDITNVAADNQSMVWVDEDWAANYGAVEVTGATVVQEAVESFPIVVKNGENVVSYFKTLQEALDAAAAGTGNVTVTILEDVDLTGIDWNPVTVSAPGYPVVTVEGNNKTITGLNDMLFAGTWAGGSGLIIKDLTIENSAIVNDKDDAKGTVGVGAFIGYPQASATITLENCHLKNSSVEGGHWTGGLIGMAGGYNGNDGPVFMNLTIKGCSVTGSTITGKGSVGGVIGHGSCAAWTNVVIEETTVKDNTITSTGSSNVKAGAVMGTIGAAGQPTTANGETKTGGASVSATVAGNTVTSNGTAITTIYGRQGTATGQLYVAGGSYDNYPIEQGVAYAAPVEGYVIVENADGTYGLDEKVELPEVVITDIKESLKDSDPDLTFALNFTIKDLENLDEEYLNKVMEQYGSWYTDYVLTISGLTEENVTFNANGNGDGYLAGQYDAWSENWVSVPFEDVTLADGESIYIMEYAAKLMGQSGLRYTLAEIATIVQNFDCGVYFSPEFLTANPGLQVDLHLKVFTEDAEGNKVNDINVATNEFDVEDYVAIVHASGKQTTYCTTLADAVAAAEADETITLIADVELTETLNIPAGKEVVLDLNGKTISQTKEQTAGYQMILNDGNLTINDSSEAKTGKISYTDSGNGGEYISDVIYNRSVLVINGGTIENLSSATVASNGYPHAVDTYSGIRDTYVEINGGTIYCAEYSAIRMFCVSATNKADLVINGGTIKGAIDMQNGTKNLALGTLTINDGTFETTKNANNIRFANWNSGATEYGISAAIKGGSFNGGITTTYVPAAANWDKGVITGGTFAKDMTEYCAEGFVCEANSDGTYGVVADPSYIAELTIDDANPVDYTSEFEGKTVGKLTYKRSLIGGIWNPFFVPFEIDIERLVNEFGLEVAYYNQMISTENADGGFDYKMEVKHLTSGVISHYPLFVKVATDTEIEYVAEDVVLGSADEFVITTSSVTNTFKLYGTHQAKSVSDLEGKYAINASNGLWTPSTSGIKPHRLYFEIQENNNNPFSSSPAKSIGIVVRGEEGFTGIEEVTGDANENVIFDLQGRRILEPQKGGLYIINGKKVIY